MDEFKLAIAAFFGAIGTKALDYLWSKISSRQDRGAEAETLSIVEPRIAELRAHMDDRFDELSEERRTGDARLHEKLDETKKELGLIDRRQTELEGRVSADSGRLHVIEGQLVRMDQKLDNINSTLIEMARDKR